jgi:2-isopropylmalate synthase
MPYAGDLVFTAFSGSHQDAIKKGFAALKDSSSDRFEVPYLTIDPADIGRQYDPVIRVNSQSGKGGVSFLVESELGFQLPRRLQIAFSQVVQRVTDTTGREMPAHEVAAKFVETYLKPPATLIYHSHTPVPCEHEDEERYKFSVTYRGETLEIEGQGAGPIDAFVHAIRDRFSLACDILDYHEHAMEAGSDSTAAAYILVRTPDGQDLFGVGQHRSITKASLLGLVAAINRSLQTMSMP